MGHATHEAVKSVTGKIRCPGCTMDTEIGFRYPGFMSCELFGMECSACKSDLFVKVKRSRTAGKLDYGVRVTKKSAVLHLLEQEEIAHKLKDIEQIDAEAGA